MDASARRSSGFLSAFAFFYPCFAFLLLLSILTGPTPVAARSIPGSDRLWPRQEATSSVSLEPFSSSTDPLPGPSSSDVTPSSSSVFETSPVTPPPATFSSPSPSFTPSTTPPSITPSSSDPVTSSSSTSASSQSESISESLLILEASSSATITSLSSSTSRSSSASTLLTVPATTLTIDNTLPPPTSDTEPGVQTFPINPSGTGTSDPAAVGASSRGFWGNRAAVIATLTIVSLVAVVLLILAATTFWRRRARQRKQEEDLYRDPSFIDDNADRFSSPGASIRQKPLEPFASNDVVYTDFAFQDPFAYPATNSHNATNGQFYDATVRPYQEQAGYIPTTSQAQRSDSSHNSGRTASAYWVSDTPKVAVKSTPKQYMLPSQAQAAANASNTYYSIAQAPSKEEPVRASLDSFYGYKGNQQPRH